MLRYARQSRQEYKVTDDMRRTKEESLNTREALLDAAEALFAEQGVSRTSLQQIAERAGLTRGAVYWHFADKAALFNAMMERTTLPLEEAVRAMDNAPEPPLEVLRRMAHHALERIAHDPRTRRVFDIATHKVEYVDELSAVRDRQLRIHGLCQGHIHGCFARAQALGHIRPDIDCEVAAMTHHAQIDGLIQVWMLAPERFDLVQMGLRSVDLFFDGLRVR